MPLTPLPMHLMSALRFAEYGSPDVLDIEVVPHPSPGPGELRVRVAAAGLNFADTERRRGLYGTDAALPFTLGSEAAGVVDALGPGVDPAWLGKRVTGLGTGCLAQFALLQADAAAEVPAGVDDVQAASLPVQGLTAWHLLHTAARVGTGTRVLVHSAAGGVGTLLVQLALAAGARVLAAVGSEEKAALVRTLGVDDVFVGPVGGGALEAWVQRTAGGADLVLDAVGRDTFAASLACLAPFGHLVTYGTASGLQPPVHPEALFDRSLCVSSYWLRTPHAPGAHTRALQTLLAAVEEGWLQPFLGRVGRFSLQAAREAHRALESRASIGKWVLTFD